MTRNNPELINRGQAPDHGICIVIALVKGQWQVMRMEEGYSSIILSTHLTFEAAAVYLATNPLRAFTSMPYETPKTVTLVSPEGVTDD